MFSLHSLAAVNIVIGVDFLSKAIIIVCALLLLIAFFVGFTKGFRKIGWKGAACVIALDLTIGVRAILKQHGLVVNTSVMQQFGEDKRAWTAILVLLAAVALVSVIYGILTKTMRPYSKWVTSNPIYLDKGWEYEDDTAEVRGEIQQRLIWKNATAPNMFGRIVGGLVSMLNMTAWIFAVLSVGLIAIGKVPSLAEVGALKSFLAQPEMKVMYAFVSENGPDFLCIFLIFSITLLGTKHGFTYSIFDFVKTFGGFLCVVLACFIPFSNWVAEGGFLSMLAPVISTFSGWIAAIPVVGTLPGVADIVGKVILAIILMVAGLLIIWLVKILLAKLVLAIESKKGVRTTDGVFGSILYFILSIFICIIICSIFYACEYYGWYDVSVFFEGESFVGHLYSLCKTFVGPLFSMFSF